MFRKFYYLEFRADRRSDLYTSRIEANLFPRCYFIPFHVLCFN